MIDQEVLYLAARETQELLPRVRDLIPDTTTPLASEGGTHQRAPAAPTPWNDLYAFTAYAIADDARSHEIALTMRLFRKATYRPRTDDQAHECIGRLPVLIAHAREALGDDDQVDVEPIAKALAGWPRRCREVLGELRADEQPWSHAPGGLVCPHCESRLWLRPGWADRRGANPQDEYLWCRRCTDDDGGLLSWAPSAWTGLVLDAPEPPRWRDADGAVLATAAQAGEHIAHLRAATVRQWASRGRVASVATTPDGARLYRLAHLEAVLA